MKIVVLGGGISTERNISLVTSISVCRALRSLGHKAIFVDMFFGLEDYNGVLEDAFDTPDGFCSNVNVTRETPDIERLWNLRKNGSNSKIGKYVFDICILADCVFIGLHGTDGEDGKIQATLDLLGVPYTGSSTLGSAIAIDKSMTKKIMQYAGIPTPKWSEYYLDVDIIPAICDRTKLPCVVKVVDGGSSIGVYICEKYDELKNAILEVVKYNKHIIIEEKVFGREFTVPVLDGKALNVIEIIPPKGMPFDYIAKYQTGDDGAIEICPANISREIQIEFGKLAVRIHNALDLSVYSRTDIILDKNNNAWCLEVNTLPGMTPTSLLPRSAKLEGLDYAALCERIVKLSIDRKKL